MAPHDALEREPASLCRAIPLDCDHRVLRACGGVDAGIGEERGDPPPVKAYEAKQDLLHVSGFLSHACLGQKNLQLGGYICGMRLARATRGEKYDPRSVPRQPYLPRGLAQHPLAAVAVYRVAKLLRRNEGDLTRAAFRVSHHCDTYQPSAVPLAVSEDLSELPPGLDGLHRILDGELLATLGTTTGQDLAAALGGHAGAEAVGLDALELVGLIRTLHDSNPLIGPSGPG